MEQNLLFKMKKIIYLLLILVSFTKTVAQNQSVTTSGDIIQLAIPAVALGSTFIWDDDDTKPTYQFLKSFGTAIIITSALKHIVKKPRPDGTDNFSFPSGHTTSAFSGAAFIQRRYGWEYGIPSYLLASFVGYSRIQAKKHDSWDVLAGATIGISSAYIFTKPYQKSKIDVTYQKVNDGFLIGMNYTF